MIIACIPIATKKGRYDKMKKEKEKKDYEMECHTRKFFQPVS